MNSGALDPVILGPALLAGLLVLSTHVPLGRQVLRRGIIFIDLAVAQMAGLGVLAAHVLGWESEGLAPSLETEIWISPDGREVRQVLHNGAPR